METKPKILLIEDEKNISDSLTLILEEEGYCVNVSPTGKNGLKQYPANDLLILDLMLPDINGLDVLKEIRKTNPVYPILIVSALSSEDDLITGLSMGADDYITKPFSVKELVHRIKRTLKRQTLYQDKVGSSSKNKFFLFGKNMNVDFERLTAVTSDGARNLTSQEANILFYLISNQGKVISRKNLLEQIWGHNREIETRTIDNFIVRFRKYFELDPKNPKHFITKRGEGYIFCK